MEHFFPQSFLSEGLGQEAVDPQLDRLGDLLSARSDRYDEDGYVGDLGRASDRFAEGEAIVSAQGEFGDHEVRRVREDAYKTPSSSL